MPTEVIAELSTSHGGDAAWQERLIEAAAGAGVDFTKFQSYRVSHLSPDDPQYAWFKQSELSENDHERLMRLCQKHGMKFLTTVFNPAEVAFLASLGLDAIKVGSGEGGNVALLREVAKYPWKVYLSTGLVTRAELDRMNATLAGHMVTLLHTVSEYPTPLGKANLGRIHWLEQHCNRPVGYSDHTEGPAASLTALAMGAEVLEVHLSMKSAPRFKPWDKTPGEVAYLVHFRDMVAQAKRQGPMVWSPSDVRPFVGRWNA